MQTINIPKGHKLVQKDDNTYEIRPIKPQLPKTWEELERVGGAFVTKDSRIGLASNCIAVKHRRNIFSTQEEAEASTALAQLTQLRKVYRQGWEPDWEDEDSAKYAILPRKSDFRVTRAYSYAVTLSFQDEETAILFLKNFRDLIEKASPLLS